LIWSNIKEDYKIHSDSMIDKMPEIKEIFERLTEDIYMYMVLNNIVKLSKSDD